MFELSKRTNPPGKCTKGDFQVTDNRNSLANKRRKPVKAEEISPHANLPLRPMIVVSRLNPKQKTKAEQKKKNQAKTERKESKITQRNRLSTTRFN